MTSSTFDDILRERELKNEKTVAFVRFLLSAAGIFEFLSFFKIISLIRPPSTSSLIIAIILFIYSKH